MEMIKVVELKKEDVSVELQAKYFVNNEGYSIDRFHLPQLTEEMYMNYILSLPNAEFAKLKDANKQFETASYYYKDKASKELVAKDFGVSSKALSFKDYTKNERWYTHYSTEDQILEEIIPYFTPSIREERGGYAVAARTIDKERLDTVYWFCEAVIKQHKVILFTEVLEEAFYCARRLLSKIKVGNVSKKDIEEFTDYEKRLIELVNDKNFINYLQKHNDEEILDTFENPKDKINYLETYKRLYNAIGLDFTETDMWKKHISVEALDFFPEFNEEDSVELIKRHNLEMHLAKYAENYDDWESDYYESAWSGEDVEDYAEEEGDEY